MYPMRDLEVVKMRGVLEGVQEVLQEEWQPQPSQVLSGKEINL